MGTLIYSHWSVEFDDRLLAHLQIVIVNTFRRGEPFLMSWVDSVAVGSGRSSIWLTPTVPAYFRFGGSRVPAVDPQWLRILEGSAESSTGLIVTDEQGAVLRIGGAGSGHTLPRSTAPQAIAR